MGGEEISFVSSHECTMGMRNMVKYIVENGC